MSQQNAFDYATMGTIHEEGHAFRLLRLLSGRGPEICCELIKAYLSDLSHAMPYAALSYTWGDTKMSESIILNGKSHLVTPNLYHALENLRWENEDRILWVDSICINQKEHKEKNHQLVYMATIYREAERVIFWLGPSTYETDLLMSALNSLQRQTYKVACNNWKIHDTGWVDLWSLVVPDHHLYPQYWSGLRTLLDRPWFRRIWILQECAHAKTGVIACGRKSIASRIFSLAPWLLGIEPQPYCQAVLDIMPGSPRQSWWTEQRDLYTLLLKFHESKASNPRDMIYALLSMATDVEAMGFPTINYNLSVQEILEQTVLFLFPCQWKQDIPNYQTFLDLIKDLMMLNNMAILEAAENGQDIVLHRLTTRAGVEPNFSDARGRTSLLCAIDQGHVGVVRHLLTLPSTNKNLLDEEKRTPLLRAIGKHRTEIANLLLNTRGVDVRCPDREGRTPLCLAVETKQHAIVEYLLDSGCPTTVDRERILPLAVQNDDAEIFLRLLKYGSFNSIIRERWESASTLCTWMFTTLTGDNGANINARDCEGKTLLSIAIEQRLLDLVQRLTKVDGLDVTFQDGKGETPMTNAVKTRDKELVEFLQHQLQKVDRVAVNMLNRSSENPLLIAVEMGDMDMVSTLLKADGIIFWATGTTSPLDAAKSRKDEEMVKFLIAHHVYAKGISIAQIVDL